MLPETSKRTLLHYEHSAESFRDGTLDHDVSQNIGALLSAIRGVPPFKLLDFGCGPGRDLRRFRELGHHPVGLDGCASFVEMAREFSGAPVWHQEFLSLSLPASSFDGIFANASLFHVPSTELPRVLKELCAALVPNGVLFCSNPRGNEEGWSNGRWGCFFDLERWTSLFTGAGFELVQHYYRPSGKPCAQQPWLAMVWRKSDVSDEP